MKIEIEWDVIAFACLTFIVSLFILCVYRGNESTKEIAHNETLAKMSIEQAAVITQQKGKRSK